MAPVKRILARLAGLFRKSHREREIADEFESHFQMHIEDNLRAGMTLGEARRRTLLKFGGVDSAKEAVRDMSTTLWIENTFRDLRYAVRGLLRTPSFSMTAVLSLALGIGASLAIFAVADSLLLRPLPFRDPNRVVMVWERNIRTKNLHNPISAANYFDWRAQNNVFESMAAFGDGRVVLSYGDRVEELRTRFATAGMLPMLGVKPFRGRFFTEEEDAPKGPDVVVISYRLWQGWFAGDDAIVGRKIQVRSKPATVLGVLPPGFYFLDRNIDVWEPIGFDPARDYRASSGRGPSAAARLKPGVTFQQAQNEMAGIARRLEIAYPKFNLNWTVNLEPVRDAMVREVKTSLRILLGAVGLLLLVACANVANLLLARYSSRRREIAVRMAIGAGRARVVRQLITENMLLAFTGSLLALGLARLAVKVLVALAPQSIAENAAVSIDLRVASGAFALAAITGLLFGLAPSLIASRHEMAHGLREAGRSGLGGGFRLRSILVGAEVALSLVLLAGAGLLFRSLAALQGVDPGLDPKGLVTFRLSLPTARYPQSPRWTGFFSATLDKIRCLPAVRSASAVSFLPFDGLPAGTDFVIEGRQPQPGDMLATDVRTVMPGYFQTMGIPLKRGRDFTDADNTAASPLRFVVSETFARRFFASDDAIGKRISVAMGRPNPFGEIIGVVGDVKGDALNSEPEPTVYYVHASLAYNAMIFLVRTGGDPLALTDPVRHVIHSIDAGMPVASVRTMESVVGETFARQRFSAVLLVAFSAISLLLAAVGIYGVLAYAVTERTREIGVRMALGAEPANITALVIRGAVAIVLPGAAVGLAGAFALTGLLRSLLFAVKPHDAVTFFLAPVVIAAAALIAAYLPARRASRLMPLDALRTD